jgi:hypothetical protein
MKWILVAAMVAATVLSDLLQSHEMKRAGEQSVSARGLTRLLHIIAQRRLLIRCRSSRLWRWCKPNP